MRRGLLPKVRTIDVVMTELDDELLVYDLRTSSCFCLNPVSAAVWHASDGQTTVPQIAALVAASLGEPVDERVVWLALSELKDDGLLEDADEISTPFEGMSRREALRTIGMLSASLPVIYAVRVPTAAAAATNCSTEIGNCTFGGVDLCVCLPINPQGGSNINPDGCPCATNGDCAGNCQCENPCTAPACPQGETCQSGVCAGSGGGGSGQPCNGTCPTGVTCVTEPGSSFGTCAGTCLDGNNVCVGAGAPAPGICIPGDTSNRNPDCCPCSNVEGCLNCCNDGTCGPCIG